MRKIKLFSLAVGIIGFLALSNPLIVFGVESTVVAQPSLNSDILFSLINAHRTNLKLPLYLQEEKLCALAKERAPEIHDEIYQGKMHSGLYDRKLSFWITENIINHTTEASAFQWWMNSFVHRSAIEGNYTYSCGACSGNSCVQLFTSFLPKVIVRNSK